MSPFLLSERQALHALLRVHVFCMFFAVLSTMGQLAVGNCRYADVPGDIFGVRAGQVLS